MCNLTLCNNCCPKCPKERVMLIMLIFGIYPFVIFLRVLTPNNLKAGVHKKVKNLQEMNPEPLDCELNLQTTRPPSHLLDTIVDGGQSRLSHSHCTFLSHSCSTLKTIGRSVLCKQNQEKILTEQWTLLFLLHLWALNTQKTYRWKYIVRGNELHSIRMGYF